MGEIPYFRSILGVYLPTVMGAGPFGNLPCAPGGLTMKKPYRLIIAEDHTILREGLRALIGSNPELEVIGEAINGRDAVRRVEKLGPDLVLMDLSMPKCMVWRPSKRSRSDSPKRKS